MAILTRGIQCGFELYEYILVSLMLHIINNIAAIFHSISDWLCVCRFVDTSGPTSRSMTGDLRCSMIVNTAGRVLTMCYGFRCKLLPTCQRTLSDTIACYSVDIISHRLCSSVFSVLILDGKGLQ